MCNREIKFGVFRAWAADNGFAAVATGHYARRDVAADGSARLLEGADRNKDQSYFLALLSQEQLRGARFPIGDLEKPELRRIARDAGLATADKKDSQGICFIGEVKMADFLRAYVPDRPGAIVRSSDGGEVGRHRGLHYYTLGQRRGIGVPSNTDNERYVVVGKRAADNALLVGFDHPDAPGLFESEVRVHSLSWTGEPVDRGPPHRGAGALPRSARSPSPSPPRARRRPTSGLKGPRGRSPRGRSSPSMTAPGSWAGASTPSARTRGRARRPARSGPLP